LTDPIVVRSAEEIAALPEVTHSIKGDGVRDDDLAGLSRLAELAEVYLDGCQELGNRALEHVSGHPHLRVFYVSGKEITDDGLAALATCAELTELGLDAPVTGAGFRHLTVLTKLREIHLPMFPGGTPGGIETLTTLPALKKLCFYGVAGLDDTWLAALAGSKTLRELVLMGCRGATEEGIAALRARRPGLSIEVM
jgi:hypothetical protein